MYSLIVTAKMNYVDLQAWLANGTIKPYVSATYPLADVALALNDIMTRQVTGKVVLVTGDNATTAS